MGHGLPVTALKEEFARNRTGLWALLILAIFLMSYIVYQCLADTTRFPIRAVKIRASFEHVSREQLETLLSKYINNTSFFFISISKLNTLLLSLPWIESVDVKRKWPDILEMTLVEKKPIARWEDGLITMRGDILENVHSDQDAINVQLPRFVSAVEQKMNILQGYLKLNQILINYGLSASEFKLDTNQAWEIVVDHQIRLKLGKQSKDIEKRLSRFCKAYPALFSQKPIEDTVVDLRYPHGMAIREI